MDCRIVQIQALPSTRVDEGQPHAVYSVDGKIAVTPRDMLIEIARLYDISVKSLELR